MRDEPGLAVEAFETLLGALPRGEDTAKFKMLAEMRKRFEGNAVAIGRLRLMEGRQLERVGRTEDALRVYSSAVLETMSCQEVGLALLDNAARLLLARKRLADAVALHEKAYYRAPELQSNAFVPYSTRFAVGVRWALLSRMAGDEKAFKRILGGLIAKYKGGPQAQAALMERLTKQTYADLNTTSAPSAD